MAPGPPAQGHRARDEERARTPRHGQPAPPKDGSKERGKSSLGAGGKPGSAAPRAPSVALPAPSTPFTAVGQTGSPVPAPQGGQLGGGCSPTPPGRALSRPALPPTCGVTLSESLHLPSSRLVWAARLRRGTSLSPALHRVTVPAPGTTLSAPSPAEGETSARHQRQSFWEEKQSEAAAVLPPPAPRLCLHPAPASSPSPEFQLSFPELASPTVLVWTPGTGKKRRRGGINVTNAAKEGASAAGGRDDMSLPLFLHKP